MLLGRAPNGTPIGDAIVTASMVAGVGAGTGLRIQQGAMVLATRQTVAGAAGHLSVGPITSPDPYEEGTGSVALASSNAGDTSQIALTAFLAQGQPLFDQHGTQIGDVQSEPMTAGVATIAPWRVTPDSIVVVGRSELIGTPGFLAVANLVPGDDRQGTLDVISETALGAGEVLDDSRVVVVTLTPPAGERRVLLYDAHGRIVGMAGRDEQLAGAPGTILVEDVWLGGAQAGPPIVVPVIHASVFTSGGNPRGFLSVSAVTLGDFTGSFLVSSTANEDSTIAWLALTPAPSDPS